MRFGLFGSAQARRPQPGTELTDSSQGFREWIDNNVEAEALGFHSTFVVEHHFTGFGQVSASLNLLTWLGARTSTLRLGTAVLVLPWHNPEIVSLKSGFKRIFGTLLRRVPGGPLNRTGRPARSGYCSRRGPKFWKRRLKRASWPPVSSRRCWPPVQAGCDFGSISRRSVSPSLP